MGSNWQEFRLDELTQFIIDCPHSTPKWTDDGVVVLRSQNIRNGRLDLSTTSYTDEKGYEARIKRAVPSVGDIVLTREAPMGEVCIIPANLRCCLGQRMVLIRVNINKIYPKFLLYILQSPYLKHQISWNEGTGTTVSNIRIPNINAFQIPTPSLYIQSRIVEIMDTIDQKIALNRQMNQTLEQMAQALFKSWFVDFDPVIDNALDAGNTIPEPLQTRAELRQAVREKNDFKTLPQAIGELFPNAFEESELGWIPKGWEISSLGEITTELRRGISPKYIDEGGIQVINQKCIRNHEINYSLTRRNNIETRNVEGRELKIGDVLINSTGVGTLGRVAQVNYLPEPTVIDSHVTIIRSDDSKYLKYSFGQLMYFLENTIETLGEGSTGQTELSRKIVSELRVVLPPLNIMSCCELSLKGFSKKMVINRLQIMSLTKLRDTLLPKLISGELSLADIELD